MSVIKIKLFAVRHSYGDVSHLFPTHKDPVQHNETRGQLSTPSQFFEYIYIYINAFDWIRQRTQTRVISDDHNITNNNNRRDNNDTGVRYTTDVSTKSTISERRTLRPKNSSSRTVRTLDLIYPPIVIGITGKRHIYNVL